MSQTLLDTTLIRLASQPKGREGTLRELVGETLWARMPSPTRDARTISHHATNLLFLRKDDRNHRVFRVV